MNYTVNILGMVQLKFGKSTAIFGYGMSFYSVNSADTRGGPYWTYRESNLGYPVQIKAYYVICTAGNEKGFVNSIGKTKSK